MSESGSVIRHWIGRPSTYVLAAPTLSVLSAATGLLIPVLLRPAEFGVYVLLATAFQYASQFDLGLSQLMDRSVARAGGLAKEGSAAVQAILLTRIHLGVVLIVLALAGGLTLPNTGAGLSPALMVLAGVAGVLFMVSMGAVTLYRASSRTYEFTVAAITLHAGLTVPRLIGIVTGGVEGCFIALAAWYGVLAVAFNRRIVERSGGGGGEGERGAGWAGTGAMLGGALPLFVAITLWTVFLTASRWFSFHLSSEEAFGLFAFGGNLVTIVVGGVAPVAQVYYPKRAAEIGRAAPFAVSAQLVRDLSALSLGLAVVAALGVALMPLVVSVGFKAFVGAIPAARVVFASTVPLVIASWLSPLILAVVRRPLRDSLVIYPIGLLATAAAMALGDHWGGIVGQSWGVTLGALVVVVAQIAVLRHARVLTTTGSLALVAALLATTGSAALVAALGTVGGWP